VRPDTFSNRHRVYLLARVIVARHYRRPLTLAAVARALSVSPRQLQRAYAQHESSFHEDLHARRMAIAARLLADQPAIPVADVGRLVGYRGTYFARAFRRRYGLSPATFRHRALRHRALRHSLRAEQAPRALPDVPTRNGGQAPRARLGGHALVRLGAGSRE
jgi:AraC-like DNA-binding protein